MLAYPLFGDSLPLSQRLYELPGGRSQHLRGRGLPGKIATHMSFSATFGTVQFSGAIARSYDLITEDRFNGTTAAQAILVEALN